MCWRRAATWALRMALGLGGGRGCVRAGLDEADGEEACENVWEHCL